MAKINKEELISLLGEMVKIQSPYFEEDDVMDYVLNWLQSNNIDAQLHTFHEPIETDFHGKNVVGCIDSGKEGPVIYLGGHLDTVKLCNGWQHKPFEAEIEGDYMYGVGTLDMKSGCAAIMLAVKNFIEETAGQFMGKIVYHFVSDEEGPYGLGTVFIINDEIHNIKDEADFAIITEPSAGFTGVAHPCLCLGARGGYNFEIKVTGKSAHAATPELGINALEDAAKIIGKLKEMEPARDDKLEKSSTCVIGVTNEVGACSVPDWANIEVFHHAVRGETMETIREKVNAAIGAADIEGSATIEFRQSVADGFDGGFIPYCIDEDDEILQILKEAVKEECKKEGNIAYFQSIGDFNHIGGKLEIPTVLFGPNGDNFHSHDERVNLSDTVEVANSICKFLIKTLAK